MRIRHAIGGVEPLDQVWVTHPARIDPLTGDI